jgi:hypothetical protein
LGDEPVDIVPTLEELKQMSYMDLIIKEVGKMVNSYICETAIINQQLNLKNLRKSGPVDRLITRIAAEDIQLADTIIPKGTNITVDVAALHLSPKNWENPDQFIPERFEEGGEYDSNTGTTWLPFSGGSRQC